MEDLIKKPELYLGIATLIVVGIFMVKAIYKPVIKSVTKITFPSVTPMPSPTITPTKAAEAKQVTTQKPTVKKSIQQIKKFADTGTVEIVVKEGDNFWKVAEQVCGNGIFADSIQEKNGYRGQSLQPGDILMISCE